MAIKDLLLRIKGDSSQLQKETKKAQGVLSGFKKTVGMVGAAIGAAFVVKGLINFGKNLINISSQAEEVRAKFNTVFKDVQGGAAKSADELSRSYGLSSKASEELLANTGDLLTGLGMGGDVALDLSTEVNKLAVDLASFSNYAGGAEGASAALTKALLGERESVKSLGIVITEEMVKQKLAEKGMGDLTGQALLQAKAMATLEIATGQSQNAIGDYARTQDSFANTSRTLTQRLDDVKIMLGDFILPIATKVKQAFVALVPKLIEFINIGATKVRNVANSFIDLYNESEAFRVVIGVIGATVKTIFGAIQLAVRQVATGFKTLGKIVGAAFRGQFKEIPNIIKEGFGQSIDNIEGFGKKAAENFGKGIESSKKAHLKQLVPDEKDKAGIGSEFNKTGVESGREFGKGVKEGLEQIDPLGSLFDKRADDKSKSEKKAGEVQAALSGIVPGDEKKLAASSGWTLTEPPELDFTSQIEESNKYAEALEMVGDAALDMGNAIMDAGIQSEGSMEDFGKTVLNIVRKTISALIAQGVANVISSTLAKSAALGPFAIPIAAGAGGLAAAMFNSAIPSFADGGVVDRPTLAMIGDAKDGRPEYVLNSGQMDKMMGGTLRTRLEGRDLWIILDRENKRRSRG